MRYYIVFTQEYQTGCSIEDFDNEADLMSRVNNTHKTEFIEIIVKGDEVLIEAKEVVKEWKIKTT